MKICVLVKEVPDAAVEKRMDPNSKRLDRSGEKNLNPFDTHAIEAAMQIKDAGRSLWRRQMQARGRRYAPRQARHPGVWEWGMNHLTPRGPAAGRDLIDCWQTVD